MELFLEMTTCTKNRKSLEVQNIFKFCFFPIKWSLICYNKNISSKKFEENLTLNSSIHKHHHEKNTLYFILCAFSNSFIASLNAVIACLLAIVNYLKLDAASEAHKISSHQYLPFYNVSMLQIANWFSLLVFIRRNYLSFNQSKLID